MTTVRPMVDIANEPAVVLLAVTLASALIVAEFALPTLGVAGTAAALLIVLAGVGINDADLEWWPLSLVGSDAMVLPGDQDEEWVAPPSSS